MRITFLLHTAYGIGGTIRATALLAGALADRPEVEDVEIISVYRPRDEPAVPPHPRVRLTSLVDARRRGWRYRNIGARRPSRLMTDPGPANSSLPPSRLTDRRLARALRRSRADVVIATRPVLVDAVARYAPERVLRMGQEHRTLDSHTEALRAGCLAALPRLDAYATVSEADARQWREALPAEHAHRVVCVPNTVPDTGDRGDPAASKVIVAAGRLIPIKRYDRLVEAFGRLAKEFPDWELRIYGRGRREADLRERITRLGLEGRAHLMGAVSPIEPEWAKGGIAAVTSNGESFGMTIVEAMRCGVPVVSTDCPYGPGEIITHGENGVLVPLTEGGRGIANALRRLMDDPAERSRLGEAGRKRAGAYDPERIAGRWLELIGECARRRRGVGAGGVAAPVSAPDPGGSGAPEGTGGDGTGAGAGTTRARGVPGSDNRR
ncbi:glycosyltransferase [Streptomyces sp. ST2-7A]|uniref:glycosyltransferase n=1 Tax=Streptomyces sp. ST2-7A TaxID=2907214 RepID=UPI001F345BD3|nr:glycosyltransferase [Streptomyces sp. ST2-7A]MCE7079020.1 glycosyltransferase [Streptomyces sp. ST2-7A]